MLACLLAVALSAAPGPLPIPGVKGQVLDPKSTRFHVPQQLSQVERFYREAFKSERGVSIVRDGDAVVLRSHREGDRWSRAVLRDQGVGTTIEITPVIAMGPVDVRGTPPVPVALVIERSAQVDRQLQQITEDHAPQH